MPEIIPFQALYYNQEKFKDLSPLVCPPYDVISSREQDFYFSTDPHNFIQILLRKDDPAEDKYKKTGKQNYILISFESFKQAK